MEYASNEYRNRFITELSSFYRILIAVVFLITPFPVLLYFIAYFVIKKILASKKRAKLSILLLSMAVLFICLIINFRTIPSNLADNFMRIGKMIGSLFQYFINMINSTVGLENTIIDCGLQDVVTWFLGGNILSFSFYFFITALFFYFYKTADEIFYTEANRTREKKFNKAKGQIEVTQKGHVFIGGTTGSGKTANIMHYIKEAFETDKFIAVIDGKGDMKEYSLYEAVKQLCEKHNRPLYIINQSDIGETTAYNPFRNGTPTQIKDMLLSMSEWSEEYYKTQAERYWQCMAGVLTELNIPISFKQLILYSDRLEFGKLIKDRMSEIPADLYKIAVALVKGDEGKNASSASARFSVIAEGDGSQMFSDDGFNMEQAYLNNGVVLVLLNDFAYSEFSKSMGHLVIEDMKNLISRINSKSIPSKDILYVFDEISVYINSQIIGLFNRGRSAEVKVVAGTQSISDIDFVSEALRKRVLECCNNYIK